LIRPLIDVVRARWQSRAALGATIGLRLLGPYALLILVVLLIGGPEPTLQRGLTVRLDLLVITYPLGAAVGGALMAVLLPLCRRLSMAVIAGMSSFAWFAAGIAVTLDHGYTAWRLNHTVTTVLMSGIFGGSMGYQVWRALRLSEPDQSGEGTPPRASYLT
jgi:hypothetical protein